MKISTIDAHAAGGPLRLVVDGFPSPQGKTMLEKRDWARRNAGDLYRAILFEPRGHADMCGAVLTEPCSPGAHAGVLFFQAGGFTTMSGHGILAVTKIALERGLVMPGGDGTTIVFDTPAGIVKAAPGRYTNVPSFVRHAGLPVQIASRTFLADVAYGGAFYAIVDSESAGLAIDAQALGELRRIGVEIARTLERTNDIRHPLDAANGGVHATIFTGPSHDGGADLRNVTVFSDGSVDRSPCGTGTSAVMAVIDAMGLLGEDRPFVHESIVGTRFTGRITGQTRVGEYPAIITEIEGDAWITGEHTFVFDDRDPLRGGFRI
jgi:proline racemase